MDYEQPYMNQLVRILGTYFNLLDSQTPIEVNSITLSDLIKYSNFPTEGLPNGTGFRLDDEDIVRIVVDGVAPDPVATQPYVQAEIDLVEAQVDTKVSKSGDTMTGDLTVPTLNANLVNVDTFSIGTYNTTTVNATDVNTTNLSTSTLVGNVTMPANSTLAGTNYGSIKAPGTVLQVVTARLGPGIISYASLDPVNTGLGITFTPLHATSLLVIQVYITGSATYVNSYGIFRNGAPTVSTSGFPNSNQPDMQLTTYYGISTPDYMTTQALTHSETAGSITARTYSVYGTSGWAGTVYTSYVNNRGANDMCSFSYMTITEVAQ
jgi:hypothetical protein